MRLYEVECHGGYGGYNGNFVIVAPDLETAWALVQKEEETLEQIGLYPFDWKVKVEDRVLKVTGKHGESLYIEEKKIEGYRITVEKAV
ncbi:hypothetical protein IMZ31_19280 (plasmid) [Pontibacillus sp. ALD_SL1]|uniref:hypothetical protein n=1 Tax=Pontibacillus sp. ALD_SL1 TaxID=2777185 RepID=UPI001A9624CB|nr:hypothetical protein [Pontibacillus sp. ALD_SL1]QST02693.1 hypothetical protein IMZ31_19280 [Pontibacillus sp. ALD_SL1]